MIKLLKGDCLELMKTIEDGSVDLILTDPPYGTVKGAGLDGWENQTTEWDNVINFELMWSEINRVLRKNGKCILFSQEPFTSDLIKSAIPNVPFSYRNIWIKDHFANSLIAKKAPVNYYEDICVFSKNYTQQKGYIPKNLAYDYLQDQKKQCGLTTKELNIISSRHQGKIKNPHRNIIARSWETSQFLLPSQDIYENVLQKTGYFKKPYLDLVSLYKSEENSSVFNLPQGKKYKSNVFEYKKDYDGYHPTQKPVALLEDLIQTYSNEGNTVLDFTCGSGSTLVAAKNTNRNAIGIEMDDNYFNIAKQRIESI